MIYGNSHGYSSMKMYLQIQQRENIERAIPVYLLNYEQDTHWLSLTVGKKVFTLQMTQNALKRKYEATYILM